MRVYFSNLGCKLNQAELEGVARRFVAAGHEIAPRLEAADLHVVNTCTVTTAAARTSRKLARRAGRRHVGVRTVLTGCYVAAEPAEAAALAGVDLVVPNHEKERLLERVHEAFPAERPPRAAHVEIPYVPLELGNSRALVKVEDGCNMRCAFCIIPATRGRQRSRPVAEVVAEVEALVAGGFEEIVVTGVQISSYRDGASGLYELVEALLRETAVPRLRLTSIAPWAFDRRLLDLLAGGRVCRHFHLSLQSGCDATLRRMRRPYSPAELAALVDEIRAADPATAITTDVIVGFPGEDEREAEESLRFVREIGFARVHAFPFSARPGTEAATLPGQLPPPVIRERMDRMLEVARESEGRFRRARSGSTARVLWEGERDGAWRGLTDHYVPVVADRPPGVPAPGRLGWARLGEDGGDHLVAMPLQPATGPAAAPRAHHPPAVRSATAG